jgi:hypothetical protein
MSFALYCSRGRRSRREVKAMQNACSNCAEIVQYSVVVMISRVGVSPRVQKSWPSVLFCNACLRQLCRCLYSRAFYDAVNEAYTALTRDSASARQQEVTFKDENIVSRFCPCGCGRKMDLRTGLFFPNRAFNPMGHKAHTSKKR